MGREKKNQIVMSESIQPYQIKLKILILVQKLHDHLYL